MSTRSHSQTQTTSETSHPSPAKGLLQRSNQQPEEVNEQEKVKIPSFPGSAFNGDFSQVPVHNTPRIQPKLRLGQPRDRFEEEADKVARQVMRAPNPMMRIENSPPPGNHNYLQERLQKFELGQEIEEEHPARMLQPRMMPPGRLGDLISRYGEKLQRQEVTEEDESEEILQPKIIPGYGDKLQRQEITEEEDTEEILQAKTTEGKIGTVNPSIESNLNISRGKGQPLPKPTRDFMESRFGADFSGVRVHTDSSAVQMNKELRAQAFTYGEDIYYGAGKSPGNDELTAHELTHTIQQTGGLKLKKEVRRQDKEEEDVKQLQTKKITAKYPEISLLKETASPQSEEEEQEKTLQAKELADEIPDILNKETSSTPQPEEEEQTLQAKELTDEIPDISNKDLRSLNSEEEETSLIQAKELPGKTLVNKFSKGNTATGNFTSSPLSIQRGLLSGIQGLAERGLGWIRSRVLAPMRNLAAQGWSGIKSFGSRISTAYQQANPQIWDFFQPEHLIFRMARNQRTQLFAQATQAEQSQRAIATADSQSGEMAPVNEPSQLQRLEEIAQTIESGAETFFNIRKELLEGAVVGDFKENPTIWNTVGQIAIGFVPYAGQAADIRDLVASVQKLHKSGYKDAGEWFNLVLVGVGFIPGIGDAIKAGGRAAKGAIRRSLTTVLTKADDLLRPVLGKAKGMFQSASRQGRRFMQWASRQGTRLRQGVRQFSQRAVNFASTAGQRARGVVNRLKGRVRGLLGSAKQTASSFISRGKGLLGQAVGRFLGTAKGAFNQAKTRVSQAMNQVKAAMQQGKVIAQRVGNKIAQVRQRATSLMENFTQSAIQRGRSLLQSGRRFASQLRNKASQVGRNLVNGARQRVEGLVRNGVKFAKERAIPFIKEKLGGVKHRVKNFLQDRWNRLKERLGRYDHLDEHDLEKLTDAQRAKIFEREAKRGIHRGVKVRNKDKSLDFELDRVNVRKGEIIEDKIAKGFRKNPNPMEAVKKWAEKQIYQKTKNKIQFIRKNAEHTYYDPKSKTTSPNIPPIEKVKAARKFKFRLKAEEGSLTPELMNALKREINLAIQKLKKEFPDMNFDVIFGD